MSCIYCGQADVEFDTEHPIPQTFGAFGDQTFTLPKKAKLVCKACNNELGKLDQSFAHETMEGYARVDKRGKTLRYASPDRVRLLADFGKDYGEVYVDPIAWFNDKLAVPLDQVHVVGTVDNKLRKIIISNDNDLRKITLEKYKPKPVTIIATDTKRSNEILDRLEKAGFDFSTKKKLKAEPAKRVFRKVSFESIADEKLLRSISKILFEILVYLNQTEPTTYKYDVRSVDLESISKFIRYGGEAPKFSVGGPLLASESENVQTKTDCTALAVLEVKDGYLEGRLRLYDLITYGVRLAQWSGLTFPPTGYAFKEGERPSKLFAKRSNLYISTFDLNKFGKPFLRHRR